MVGRRTPRLIRRLSPGRAGVLALLCLLAAACWAGCGTPRERYRVLSFFFDGVPDPDKPKEDPNRRVATTEPGKPVLTIVSVHKPYKDNKCASCHRAGGMITDFSAAYKQCTKCHTKVPEAYPRMHGPVSAGGCDWCHQGHESVYPALLKDEPIKVCTQCHDENLLGDKPQQHHDGHTSCIACHKGHGGTAAYFLKPAAQGTWPSTAPATAPSTAPATAPATAPSTAPATAGATSDAAERGRR